MKTDMHFEDEYKVWFNETLLTDYFYVQEVTGRTLSDYDIEEIVMPGIDGARRKRKRKINKPIQIKAIMMYDSEEELQKAYDELNGVLNTDGEKVLEFEDEEFIYMAEYQGVEEGNKTGGNQVITLSFYRSDPHKLGLEKPVLLDEEYTYVHVDGNAEAYPVFTVETGEDLTYFQIVNQNEEYMMIGREETIDDTVINPQPTVYHDNMGNLNTWTSVGVVGVEGGTIAGAFGSDGKLFGVDNYGGGSSWHGPALRHNLPNPLQDFIVDVYFSFKADSASEVGRVELYLIGTDNSIIGKLAMKDIFSTTSDPVGEVRIGNLANGQMIASGNGYMKRSYDQFFGKLWIKRNGKKITGQIGEIVNGKPKNRLTNNQVSKSGYEDESGKYQTQLNALQIHAGQHGTRTPITRDFIHEVRVRSMVPTFDNQVPIIAEAGDTITFDHKTNNILINDSEALVYKDFGAEYFTLKQGMNKLYTFPSGAITTRLVYQERY